VRDDDDPDVVIGDDGRRLRPVKSVMRAIDLLDALAGADRALGVTDLATMTGSSKTAAYNLVTTLEFRGLVRRDADNRYRLGWAVLEYGERVRSASDLSEAARPHIEALAEATGETTLIGVHDQDSVIFLEKAESRRSIRMVEAPGRRMPLHSTAAGLVLLAFLPLDQRRSYATAFDLDRADLLDRLDAVGRAGHSVLSNEYEADMTSVAVPVRGFGSEVAAALAIAGPTSRLTAHRIAEDVVLLEESARAIGKRLGLRP
jgi:DNA-binding IclR family transcriptional regulator